HPSPPFPYTTLFRSLAPTARGHGRIRSVLLPFCCGKCHAERAHTLEFDQASAPIIPGRLRCDACGGDMSFDDLPEMYLSPLLREDRKSTRLNSSHQI